MKRLLIIGGIRSAIQIVNQAHSMGLEVYVTDYLENSPAKELADKSFMVSATDVDAVVELIRRERIDGVLTGYVDILLPCLVQICQKAGLPCYASQLPIDVTTDKVRFKETCAHFGIPVVSEYSYEDVLDGLASFPVLVKPIDNSGARGIYICHDMDEFMENYARALSFSPSRHVIIERYMTDREATIFYYLHEGKAYVTGMGNRHMHRFDDKLLPLPVGYTFPSAALDNFLRDVHPRFCAMFKALGMNEGMVFIQTFVTPERECVVYECGYRLTGSMEHHLFSHAYGFNPLAAMIDYAVGNPVDDSRLRQLDPRKCVMANVTLLMRAGNITRFEGLEEVQAMDGVIATHVSHLAGTGLEPEAMGTLKQACVRVLMTAEDEASLLNKMDAVKNCVRALDANGEDLLIKEYTYKQLVAQS